MHRVLLSTGTGNKDNHNSYVCSVCLLVVYTANNTQQAARYVTKQAACQPASRAIAKQTIFYTGLEMHLYIWHKGV